jgi:transposase
VHAGKTVDALREWALSVQRRSNHNKATCALANKLARICYATLRDGEPYGTARLQKKAARTAFALPA